jgi:spore germination protein GerM
MKADLASITLFFNNTNFNPNVQDCAAVFPVVRKVPTTNSPLQNTLYLLFAGPTTEEVALGYNSLFSEKTKDMLKSVNLKDGVVTLDFKKAGILAAVEAGANSSCGSAQFDASLQKTILNVSGVKSAPMKDFSIDGNKAAFKNLMSN